MRTFLYKNKIKLFLLFLFVIVCGYYFVSLGREESDFFMENARLVAREKHLTYRNDIYSGKVVRQEDMFFAYFAGHKIEEGKDLLFAMWVRDAKMTLDSHDDYIEKISIEVPKALLNGGNADINLSANRDVLLFYGRGILNGRRCYGYPDKGRLRISKMGDKTFSVYAGFHVKLVNEDGGGCGEKEVEKEVVSEYRSF